MESGVVRELGRLGNGGQLDHEGVADIDEPFYLNNLYLIIFTYEVVADGKI